MKNLACFLLAIMLMLLSCGKDSPITPTDPIHEDATLTKLTTNIDKLLESNDAKGFEQVISPKVLSYYSSVLNENSNKLKEFAPIFKTRKLVASDSTYAAYEVEYKGRFYEITFTIDDEGNWYIQNF